VLTIDVATVPYGDNGYWARLIVNLENDSVVAQPDAVTALDFELPNAWRPWVLGESGNEAKHAAS
jgi:hypothetical protein